MISANKGEWSELYVLFRLLGERKIHSGDGNLNKLDAFYPIIKIIRDELERHLEYSLEQDIVIITEDGNEITRVNVTDFMKQSESLFADIKIGSNGSGSFEIPSQEDFLRKIHCKKIKASSKDKADIHIVLHDYHTGLQPNLGFSIKSEAGANPTLLNASSATSFIYKFNDNMNEELACEINGIVGSRKIQDRVNRIEESQCGLEFVGLENEVFYNNLRMIDSKLPEMLGWMLFDSYKNRNMNINKAVERIAMANPFNYNMNGGHDFYGYKIKSLMVATALGMLPATVWSGKFEATGGYIVVKNDGDIICFHLYDRNLLEDYLFNNTKFETPTGKRYNLGNVYKGKDDKYYFNLNLQIRFK